MTRNEAIQIRVAQLQGAAVNPETLAAAIEIIKQRPPVNKGGRPRKDAAKAGRHVRQGVV
jgi:hypothetical protein